MATLNGEKVTPGCSVYDICYGPGIVKAVESCGFVVSFGSAGRPRKYTDAGMTGKHCSRTLYHRPPAIIEFPRDETNAAKLTCALHGIVDILNTLVRGCVTVPCPAECPEEETSCDC